MGDDATFISDRLREAVWRIEPENSGELAGTGFFVAPGILLTCAHVVDNLQRVVLKQDRRADLRSSRIVRPIDAKTLDLAIIVVDDGPEPVLACSASRSSSDLLLSRGFPGAAPGGSELRLDARGEIRAAYEGYDISSALELAGDMASKGYSGSPLVDSSTAAIVGLISAGHRARERSWAVPLIGAAAAFPALAEALAWNNDNLSAYGAMLNTVGFDNLWRAAAQTGFDRVLAVGKFDSRFDVSRNAILVEIARFLEAQHPMMGIVGDPGLGKSWLLARLAARDQR